MNICIVGTREEGKTTLAMALAQRRYEAVIAFDPRGLIEAPEENIVRSPEELEEAIEKEKWRNGPVVYRVDSMDLDDDFAEFCSVLFPPNFPHGGFAVVVDEAGLLQSANSMRPDLFRIIKTHPTKPPSVLIIQTMHTLSETYGKTRSLINEYYIFRLTARNDLDAVATLVGVRAPEVTELVADLPQHHCIRFINSRVPEGQSQWELWDQPELWHIPATTQDESLGLTQPKNSETVESDERWMRANG